MKLSQPLLEALCSSGQITAQIAQDLQKSFNAGDHRSVLEDLTRLVAAEGGLTSFQVQAIRENRIGELALGNYLLLAPIGRGGMGEVFRARHRRMDRVVALKVVRGDIGLSEECLRRFQREVKAAARLSHPNIVTAYDADEVGGRHFLVMEYVDGRDLGQLVSHLRPLSVPEAVECVLQVAAGLSYAHQQGVIHRDLKPSNLLVDREGRVKILDLGLARLEDAVSPSISGAARLTASGLIMGTVDYMAPEQAVDSRSVDRRADIYSLGCTLFFLLTGRPVFPRDSLAERLMAHRQDPAPSLCLTRRNVPEKLDRIFQQMMAKSPAERFDSASAVVAALQAAGLAATRAAEPLAARVMESASRAETHGAGSAESPEDRLPPLIAPVHPPAPWASRRRRAPIAIATAVLTAVALLMVVAGAVLWWPGRPGSREAPVPARPATAKTAAKAEDAGSPAPRANVAPADGGLERRSALRVLQLRGSLEVYLGTEKRAVSSSEELPRERFQIAQVGLGDSPVRDEDLKDLQALTRVEEMALWNTAISDAGLAHLEGLKTLRALYLNGTAVHGPGLERLTSLQRLELNGTPVDDAGLRHLATLRQLECLYLNGTSISDAGLKTLHSLANLKELHLEQTRVTPEGVARVRSALPACRVQAGS